jgi:hypothetical protein
MNYFDLFSMRLSQFHDQIHKFGRLNRVKSGLFFFLRLSQSREPKQGFGGLTQVVLYTFLIDFLKSYPSALR